MFLTICKQRQRRWDQNSLKPEAASLTPFTQQVGNV